MVRWADGSRPSFVGRLHRLDDEGQVEVLRAVALQAAEEFGLGVRRLALVLHAYNTTFRLDTDDGRRLALRVNTNSHSTPGQHRGPAGVAARDRGGHRRGRARPGRDARRALGGRRAVSQWGDRSTPRSPRGSTATTWQSDEEQARALGEAMARAARPRRGLRPAHGADLPLFDDPLFDDEDLLSGHPDLPPGGAAVVANGRSADTATSCEAVHRAPRPDRHPRRPARRQPQVAPGRLAVFDVDDCGLGVPALDLAIATFYLRDGTRGETALAHGYARRPLPDVAAADFEALAARQLLLANSLLASSTATLRSEATAYLGVTVERLRHWRSTGLHHRRVRAARRVVRAVAIPVVQSGRRRRSPAPQVVPGRGCAAGGLLPRLGRWQPGRPRSGPLDPAGHEPTCAPRPRASGSVAAPQNAAAGAHVEECSGHDVPSHRPTPMEAIAPSVAPDPKNATR